MRILQLLLILAILTSFSGHAQSDADVFIDGNTYRNLYLHFSYTAPPNLQLAGLGNLNIHPTNPYPSESLLLTARERGKDFGVIAITEKLLTPPATGEQHPIPLPRARGFRDGADFLSHIIPSQYPQAHAKVIASKHMTTPDGFVFDELDYTISNEYDSGVTIQTGQYLVAFKCSASSLSALKQMTDSLYAIRHIE